MTTFKTPSIEDIQKRIKERDQKVSKFKSTVDKSFYPFWNMEVGQIAVTRLIPDINPDNPLPYYIESFSHKLSIDGEDRTIVCPKTFDRTADCPICERSQRYYREGDKGKGSYYWRKKNSYVRLLILKNPIELKDEEGNVIDYVGRVCTSMFGNQILKAIENQLGDFEAGEPVPWLIDDGYDFYIKKTDAGGGQYADYSFSTFAKKPSGIPEEYKDDIELIDFRDLLPEDPGLEKVQHFLDAHDGVVEFQYGRGNASTDGEDSSEDGEDSKVYEGRAPKSKSKKSKIVEMEDSVSDDSPSDDDDDDEIDSIRHLLNRNRA